MSEQIVAQEPVEVKLLKLVNRADKIIAALTTEMDEDEPLGRAIFQWLLDAEAATKSVEYIFGDPPSYGCGCVLPGQHCPICEDAARVLYDGDELPF